MVWASTGTDNLASPPLTSLSHTEMERLLRYSQCRVRYFELHKSRPLREIDPGLISVPDNRYTHPKPPPGRRGITRAGVAARPVGRCRGSRAVTARRGAAWCTW